jgi:enoyl-CoA hydratase
VAVFGNTDRFAQKFPMLETILANKHNHTMVITINRPDKLNALNQTVIEELSAALNDLHANDDLKSAIITGSGPKAFVAGADISEFPTMNAKQGRELAQRGQQLVFNKIENSPKPVVAAVNGFALGGGCELAMACHFRLASENARFGQPEVNLGLIPGYGGTQRLVHLIGKGRATELLLTGNMISAQEALQLGLVNYVTTSFELLPKALEVLEIIHNKAPLAVQHILKLINTATYAPNEGLAKEIEAFGQLFDTADAKEGTTAFLEKRKATFEGK